MRTPVVDHLPPILISSEQPPRTPVLEGKVAKPLHDLLPLPDVPPEDVEASIQRAEMNPEIDPIWVECKEDMIKSSLAYFAAEMISGPPEPPYNGKFLVGWHHEEWDKLIHEHEKLVIEAARDHSKSFFFSMAYPIWRAGYTHPGKLGYIFSATQPLAEAFLALVKEECCGNERFRHLVPSNVADPKKWDKVNEIKFRNGSTIRARGMSVKVRGGHPRWAVADDILEDEDIYSETIRGRHIDYFLSAINNMVVPGGQIVVVGTPFHSADLYGYLREAGEYHCVKYPAIDDNGRLLFPERYNAALLAKRKRELASAARFAREFLCCRPGTMIETSTGQRPIEKVKIGDIVLTHTGEFHLVKRTFCREHNGYLVRVKGHLQLTPNHPVFTPNGFIDSDALVNGDMVTYPKPQSVSSVRRINFIDDCRVPCLLTSDRTRTYARGSAKHLPSGSIGKGGAKSIPVEISITRDLMRLIGLWLAEGHISSGDRLVVWSFSFEERNTLAAECATAIKHLLGLSPKVKPKESDGVTIVSVGCRIFADFLVRHFKKGAGGKRLPLWIRNIDPEMLWHLLLGYIDGDGHVSSGATVRISSVSEMLLRDFQFVAAICGLFSTIKKVHDGGEAVICKRHVMTRPSWRIDFDGGSGRAIAERFFPTRHHQWGKIHNSLEQIPYSGPVHNIEVEGDNSYVADGIAVHNCQPLSDEASLFPSSLFQGGDVRIPYQLGLGHQFWEKRGCILYTGIDFAMSASSGADFTVIITLAHDPRGNRWITNIRRGKGWGFQRQLDEIKEEYAIMRPAVMHAEANAMQRIFTDELLRETDLPIRKFFTSGVQPKQPWRKGMTQVTMSKHHMDRGVPSLRLSLENRKWRIPRGDQQAIEMTDIWMGEFQAMSWQQGKVVSVGAHDDCVMSTWFADAAVRMGGFNFSFGEEDMRPTDLPAVDPSEATVVDRAMVQVPRETHPGSEAVDKSETDPYGLSEASPDPKPQTDDDESWKTKQGAPRPSEMGFGSGFSGNF